MNKIEKHIITCMVKLGVKFVSIYKQSYTDVAYIIGFGDRDDGTCGWIWSYIHSDYQVTDDPTVLLLDCQDDTGMYASHRYIEKCVEPFYENVANYDVEPIPGRRGFVKRPCLMDF